jgi:hypothetical protein
MLRRKLLALLGTVTGGVAVGFLWRGRTDSTRSPEVGARPDGVSPGSVPQTASKQQGQAAAAVQGGAGMTQPERLRDALLSAEEVAAWSRDFVLFDDDDTAADAPNPSRAFMRRPHLLRLGLVVIMLEVQPATSLADLAQTVVDSSLEPPDPFFGHETHEIEQSFTPDGFGDGAVAFRVGGLASGGRPYTGVIVLWEEGAVQAKLITSVVLPAGPGEPLDPDGMLLAERQRDKLRGALSE